MGWMVVTGAFGGIGAGIVRRCLRDGHGVVAIGRAGPSAGAPNAPQPDGRIVSLLIDLVDPALESRVLECLGHAEPLVALVNCAAISQGDDIEHISDGDWSRSFDVNVTAPMRLARALTPRLRDSRGSIVNIASPVGIQGARKVSYAASKAALLGLNAALAKNLGRYGVRVNAVLPGPTITGMTTDWTPEKRAGIAKRTLLGRLCEPDDIAGAVAFLVGPDASYVTGAVLDVTGGGMIGGA